MYFDAVRSMIVQDILCFLMLFCSFDHKNNAAFLEFLCVIVSIVCWYAHAQKVGRYSPWCCIAQNSSQNSANHNHADLWRLQYSYCAQCSTNDTADNNPGTAFLLWLLGFNDCNRFIIFDRYVYF